MIELNRLRDLLSSFPSLNLLSIGDYFLDKYLFIDPELAEVSIETGLTAYQVVGARPSPGAAGTAASNLRAIGAGNVIALSCIGDDGNGYELKRGLEQIGADTGLLTTFPDFVTPTYTKPMLLQRGRYPREMERQDIKNRKPLPEEVEQGIIDRLRSAAGEVDAIVVSDQVQERNCGIITDRVREELGRLARSRLVVVDSRVRIGEYGDAAVIKPNQSEAARAVGLSAPPEGIEGVIEIGVRLSAGRSAPLFITLGAEGTLVVERASATHVPSPPVEGEMDVVGAGDSCLSAIACTLAAGGTAVEAAAVANLVAGVTIRKIGETGTASPEEILALAEASLSTD